MRAKVTVLYDEGALENTSLIGAKGSSFLIEADGERTMFGAGHRPRYLENNMYGLGIEADSITRVVVSHSHKDEWGGIGGVLKHRKGPVDVYAPASVWGEKTFLGSTGMFFPPELMDKGVRKDIRDWVQFSEHVYVSPPIPYGGKKPGEECVMVVKGSLGSVVICHCCHPGIESVFDVVIGKFGRTPIGFIGGIHVVRKNDKLADRTAKCLKSYKVPHVYLNHCSSQMGAGRVRVTLGLEGVHDFYVGESADFDLL